MDGMTIHSSRGTPKVSSERHIPDEYRDVARGMERQFAQYMIEQMQKTTGRVDQSTAGNYYKSLLNSERADILTKTNGGLGLQKVILDQIYPKRQALENYMRQGASND